MFYMDSVRVDHRVQPLCVYVIWSSREGFITVARRRKTGLKGGPPTHTPVAVVVFFSVFSASRALSSIYM